MKGALLLALAVISAADASCAKEGLLNGGGPVPADKTATVLKAARARLARKALRLVRPEDPIGSSAAEIVIGPRGVPQFMRRHVSYEGGMVGVIDGAPISTHYRVNALIITEFTGLPARGCDGTRRAGELIREYRNEGNGWTAAARAVRDLGYPAGAFDMLTGVVGSRIARALVASWTPRPDGRAQPTLVVGDPLPNLRGSPPRRAETTQKLWIDVDSLLPLQWETPVDALAFRYDATIAITRPEGITPPACVL